MITWLILGIFLGACVGYTLAALMTTASKADRQREQEELNKPVVCEEQKLVPIEVKTRIPRDELERVGIRYRGAYIGHKIMREVEKELQHYVIEERDPFRMEYVYTLRFWVKRGGKRMIFPYRVNIEFEYSVVNGEIKETGQYETFPKCLEYECPFYGYNSCAKAESEKE